MRILAISDQVVEQLYSPRIRDVVGRVDLVIGCGDLPSYYLEYVVSMLGAPFVHVPGNHDLPTAPAGEDESTVKSPHCWTCGNIDGRVVHEEGVLVAGLGGSVRYRPDGIHQYTQAEMTQRIWAMTPRLLGNRIRYGRALDVLATHAPPFGVHDGSDPAHVGFRAFGRFIRRFRPRLLLHGHSHVWRRDTIVTTQVGPTLVLNVCPYRVVELSPDHVG